MTLTERVSEHHTKEEVEKYFSEIFEIDGVKYKRSEEEMQDGDEVFFIKKDPFANARVPFGTKGKISSIWYDRVEYLGTEYVIWGNETAKLIPIEVQK